VSESASDREDRQLLLEGNVISHLRFGARAVPGSPLNASGGGGTYDGMEPRVAVLEANVGHIKEDLALIRSDIGPIRTDLGQLKTDVAVLKTRIDVLPTKGFILTSLASGLVVMVAILTILARVGWLVPATP